MFCTLFMRTAADGSLSCRILKLSTSAGVTQIPGFLNRFEQLNVQQNRRLHNFYPPKWDLTQESERLTRFTENPEKYKYYDQVIWPPNAVESDGTPKPGEVFHWRENIKYSHRKMWVICQLVECMSVDEALKQLQFVPRKGAAFCEQTIKEAVKKGIEEHNIEFRADLWIAELKPVQSLILKGFRKHARMRFGLVHYRYCHLFVRLQEGKPPADKHAKNRNAGWEKMAEYLQYLRDRRIKYTL